MADDTRKLESGTQWDEARYALAEITMLITHAKQDREKFWHEKQLEWTPVNVEGYKMTIPQREAKIILEPVYQEYSKKIREMEITQLALRKKEWKRMREYEHEESVYFNELAIEKSERFTPDTRTPRGTISSDGEMYLHKNQS